MLYLDVFFANLNLVVRIADFLSCRENDIWANENAEFEQNKFYYITRGNCVLNINGTEYLGKKGDWFFIPANTQHKYYNLSGEPFEKYWLHFDLYPNSTIFSLLNLDYCINTRDQQITALFQELITKYKSENLSDKLDVKSIALKLLSLFISASTQESKVALPNPEESFSALLAYINQNLERNISNNELSKLCYQHPSHFVRFFKKKAGMTPQKYIMEKRVQMAKRLIEQTDLKFSDIAIQAGFCDAPHLSKVFKKFYSISPQEYRKGRYRH